MKLAALHDDLSTTVEKVKSKLRGGHGLRMAIFLTLDEMGITDLPEREAYMAKLEQEIRRRADLSRRTQAASDRFEKRKQAAGWIV